MKVRFTLDARDELRSIAEYIGVHDVQRAKSFVRDLRTKAAQIGQMPYGNPVVRRRNEIEIRRRPYAGYLIFYIVTGHMVDIIHVIHGARDVDAILDAGWTV